MPVHPAESPGRRTAPAAPAVSPPATGHSPDPAVPPGAPAVPPGSRRPLDVDALRPLAARLGLALAVVDEIDSTNAELGRIARGLPGTTGLPGLPGLPGTTVATGTTGLPGVAGAAAVPGGAPAGLVLAAERQSAGRGRLDRSWESAAGAGLMVSVLVRPETGARWLGWLPMVVGTSLVRTLRGYAGVPAVLKWPNDVQVDGAKLAGILVELAPSPAVPPAAVIGFGLNVTARAAELPPRSTSLLLLGADPARLDRSALLGALLTDLVEALGRWEDAPERARGEYRDACATLGRRVRVELPDGTSTLGTATDVDELGRLIVDGRAFSAADIVHLR
ncbi:biotin--[acetyl-CoA-carboxylase] ligase [Parafrankia discariae]|uniref:biotin--[acetyl-CoA-carboxylase] ligase n=1 Tax=Parafrankia discariae TaxID=365528 RepID=UPI0012B69F03|nr:biotin--[acetyl-CoA-carboxylase] ligase [Parafrankia discariae]